MSTKRFELYQNLCTIDTCRTAFSRFSVLATTAVILNAVLLLVLPAQIIAVTAVCCIALAGLVTVRLEHSLYIAFFYFTFEGMIKILSGYNPIMHVSSDIFLIVFALRSLSDNETFGFSKVFTTPAFPLLAIFIVWVFTQFLNPLGLGIFPSLAALKIYLVPIIIMLLACHHMNDTAAERFTQILVGLGALMATVTVIEYLFFQDFLFNLHPGYLRVARSDVFSGAFYRPFGFTSNPGKPATFIALTAPFAVYQLFSRHPLSTKWMKTLSLYFFFIMVPALVFCQVRSDIVQTLFVIGLVLIYDARKAAMRISVAVIAMIVVGTVMFTVVGPKALEVAGTNKSQFYVLEKRILSLTKTKTYVEARHSPVKRMIKLANQYGLMGLGLSRTGASASPWSARINNHPYVDKNWVFADNVYLALLVEIGIIGLLTWLAMIFSLLYIVFRNARKGIRRGRNKPRGFLAWTCFALVVSILIAGFGSEGVLYQPVAAFMWVAFGLGVRKVSYAN